MKVKRWGVRSTIIFAITALSMVFLYSTLKSNPVFAADPYEIPATVNDCANISSYATNSFFDANKNIVEVTGSDLASQGVVYCSITIGLRVTLDDLNGNGNAAIKDAIDGCNATNGASVLSVKGAAGDASAYRAWCLISPQDKIDSAATDSAASTAETEPLINLMCGESGSGEAAMSRHIKCADAVEAAYNDCYDQGNAVGGSAGSAMTSSEGMAVCIYNKKLWNDSTLGMVEVSKDKMEKAITEGRTAADNITKEAADKAACEAKNDGSTWDATNKTCVPPEATTTESQTASCKSAADATFGFGWLLCPGYSLVTGAVDLLVGWISTGLMQWTMLSGSGASDIKNAWSSMLTIANIAFAIVFLIVIYSTATSTGLTNYSVKKILPRLVLVAVGVNISFYIAAALADLSNIAAIGIKETIFNMLNLDGNAALTVIGNVESSRWQVIGLIVLMVLAWSSVLLGLVIILAALAFRSVVLTVLVIISPLAFVAALLPNTEKWWKKWLDEYIRLLVVYPAFMLVWAGSRFVANISANTGDAAWLISALAAIAPLVAILPLFKATGGLMGKIANATEKGVMKGGGDWLKNKNKQLNSYLGKQGRAKAADYVKDRQLAKEEMAGKNAHDAVLASHADSLRGADEQIKHFEERYKDKEFTAKDSDRHAELASMGDRNAEQEAEFSRLTTKKNAWHATTQSQEYKDAMSNYKAAKSARSSVMEQAERAEADAKKKARSTAGYRTAFYNDNRRASQAENERRRKSRATSVLGTRLADEYGKSNPKEGQASMSSFLRSYTGAGAASTSAQKEAMQEALSLSQQVGNKETAESIERDTALMDNVVGAKEDGTTYTINNSQLMDLMAGRISEIPGKIGDLDYQLKAETRSQKIAVVQRLMAKGSAGEVKELLEIALDPSKESDPYIREAIISGAIKSGKAPAYLGGPAVPGINDRTIASPYQATVATAKGGIKGDIFGASVGSNQIEDFATGIEMAARGQVEGYTPEAQAAAVDQAVRYITAQLRSNNGANLVNSAEKAGQMKRMLIAGGVSSSDAEAMITRAGGIL